MAKKDTYLALLRRGIDESTAEILADAGLKIGEIKKLSQDQLEQNYGLKPEIASSVLGAIQSGPRESGKQRFLAEVLSEKKEMDRIDEQRFKRQQKDVIAEINENRERLRVARLEEFRAQKVIMNRLGKTIELIVKIETNHDNETKDEQRSKMRDQLETRGLEAARDHEMLELVGTPQDIVDFRRKIVPRITLHACPECDDEIEPAGSSRNLDDMENFSFICWECGHEFMAPMAKVVEKTLAESRITVSSDTPPRLPVFEPPKEAKSPTVADMLRADLEATGASAEAAEAAVEESAITGGLMSIDEWIDQTLAVHNYIQAQEHREDFIISTGAGATKFNKWMKKAGLYFNKQTGRWTRWEDR
ncbi:MAG: hypothetical protein CMB31_01020 [Euryarchaeota archaeon]|nr:hypothetical protein [Euryarchaeota archaeon]